MHDLWRFGAAGIAAMRSLAVFGCVWFILIAWMHSASAQLLFTPGPPSPGQGPWCYESDNGGVYSQSDLKQFINEMFSSGTAQESALGEDFAWIKFPNRYLHFHRVPCPWSNAFRSVWIEFFTAKWKALQKAIEKSRDTGTAVDFSDVHDPLGLGVSIGYGYAPLHNNILLSPFVSFEHPNVSVKHTFANGSFLGTRSDFSATLGIKVGPAITPTVWVYGLGGVGLLNETLTVFGSSKSETVFGGTLGAGVAVVPDFLQAFGRPIALFVEYQHNWWQDAHFDAPPSSAAFNYTFQRQDDVIKGGLHISFGGSETPAARPAIAGQSTALEVIDEARTFLQRG